MMSKRIPVAGPSITEKEIAYVTDAVTRAWYADANIYHQRFERAFAEYAGRKHAMALPSCTSALHLALLALGVGPGDEVIVPESTWIATAAPIIYVGATPVFADVDRATWCIAPDSVAALLSPATKAVIAVDLYGNVANYDAILKVTEPAGVALIEDAAQAAGAERGGKKAGAFGAISVFSFHGSKTLTTGEGGMLLTDDDALFRRASIQRDHGRMPGDTNFFNQEIGQKYKMSSMQAALGLAQLERLDELIARKREIFGWYREELAGVNEISLNVEDPGSRSAYWMVTAILSPSLGVDGAALRGALLERGIETRPFFHPLSSLPAFSNVATVGKGMVAYELAPFGVNLPSALSLTRDDVRFVSSAVREIALSGVTAGR